MSFKSRYPAVEPDPKYGQLASNFFWRQLDKFASKTLMIDLETGRRWSGAQVKATCSLMARNLLKYGLERHSNGVLFYKNNDHIQLAALGLLFAGSSVCVGFEGDPEHEHAHMLSLLKPAFVFVPRKLLDEAQNHCKSIEDFKPRAIVIMDDETQRGEPDDELRPEFAAPSGARVLGFHSHLLRETGADGGGEQQQQQQQQPSTPPPLPVQVDPNWPAFILLTSGSTGRPKPASRTQRNSLYVAHSLQGQAARDLWDLNGASVLSGHLALDHGTGIFQLKQMLAKGLTCVLMDGYEPERLLNAIERYAISDVVLGSALVHNFLSSRQLAERLADGARKASLSSLRNFLAVGSSIASQGVVRDFMAQLPECSVRQAFGMTECGFLCIVPRALSSARGQLDDLRVVGHALPNVELRLLEFAPQRPTNAGPGAPVPEGARAIISEPNRTGELYVRGPTVSPGYHGREYDEQSRELFMPDGFYKSGDVCSFTPDGMLRIHGRHSQILCLYDGWKVLPAEIEQVLMEHPLVSEAAVVGVSHPELPTCHAPRAYVVPREGVAVLDSEATSDQLHPEGDGQATAAVAPAARQDGTSAELQTGRQATAKGAQLSKRELFDFIAARLSEPKQLTGGIKFMRELPKISIGKVDKKSLKRMDGLL